MIFKNSCSSSAVTLAEQYWIMPSPTEAGVLGMMRMTGKSSPAISWMRAMERPAAMLHSTKRPGRSSSVNLSGWSSASIIWGFTARKIRSHPPATSALVAVLQPSSLARACALAAVRFARKTFFGSTALHTARAMAPPMLPQPRKPMVSIINHTLPYGRHFTSACSHSKRMEG